MTSTFSLEHDPSGRLVLVDVQGERHPGVEAVRAFPISDPERWISLCDGQGREILSIDDLGELPAELAKLLREDLSRREFLPVIRRILAVSAEADPSQWHVLTDRGETRFFLASEDDVQRLGDFRGMLVDSNGVRYLVRDLRELDGPSRRILDRYL
jgi:hypothetical protein